MGDPQPENLPQAATLIMIRDGNQGIEVLMQGRNEAIEFASGALVFPGGKADPQDFDRGLAPYLDNAGADAESLLPLKVAAIREAFEECGVLLAREAGRKEVIDRRRQLALEPYRQTLHRGEVGLTQFLGKENLCLACDQLVHFGHWVTPPFKNKRFDTHFFLAPAPWGHLASHDGYESMDSVWITPERALAEAERGERPILFPTLSNLRKLNFAGDVADNMAAARGAAVHRIMPWLEEREEGTFLCIPPNAGYPLWEQRIKNSRSVRDKS